MLVPQTEDGSLAYWGLCVLCGFSDAKKEEKIKVWAVIVTRRLRLPGWREMNLDTHAALELI